MRDPGRITELFLDRQRGAGKWHKLARTVRDIYNSDMILPLPEADKHEMPAVANLTFQGVEQMSMRIASTMPTCRYPALIPGQDLSENRARDRTLVNTAWWDLNRLPLKMQRRARHLTAYSFAPTTIEPDFEYERPCWKTQDPLSTYPSEMDAGEVHPVDCIFEFTRNLGWLKAHYPDGYAILNKRVDHSPEDRFTLLKYTDERDTCLVAVGSEQGGIASYENGKYVLLDAVDNRLERCWAVCPSAITLDRPKGRFDGIVGIYFTQAMLMALEVAAMKRAVYPEQWIESNVAGETGQVVTMAEPLRGVVGVVANGKINITRVDPSVLGTQMVDRLERNIRVETSIPAELGGESSGNIRTGRRGDAVMAAAVDFPVQMAQQVFEASLQVENELAVAIDKTFFKRSKSFVISPTKGKIEYEPAKLWETDTNFVRYAHAGTDANSLTVAALQRVGSGTMSKQTWMLMDPMIDDAERERDQVTYEALELAMLTSLQTRASEDPAFAPVIAQIAEEIRDNKIDVLRAYQIVDRLMKEQQAGMAPPDPLAGQPGAADPMASIEEPGPSVQGLTSLLGQLRNQSESAA